MTKRVIRAAFIASLPVLMGYLAMGMAAGILLAGTIHIPDISLWAFLTSFVNISGALQFLLVDWIDKGTPMIDVILLTLCLNLRYAMYGFSLLERFRGLPLPLKYYLIWTLTDETYAIEVANKVPEGEDSVSYCIAVAAFDHFYWIAGVVSGSLLGTVLTFNTSGIDFAMTALFLVILVDQCREKINRIPALIGACAALFTRCFFATDKMLLPTIPLILILLFVFRKPLLKNSAETDA